MKKVSVQGGGAVLVSDSPGSRGGSWGDDGNIVAAPANTGVLSRIPAAGGVPEQISELAPGERTH